MPALGVITLRWNGAPEFRTCPWRPPYLRQLFPTLLNVMVHNVSHPVAVFRFWCT